MLRQQQVNKSGCLHKAINSPDSSKLTGGQSSLDLLRVVGTSGLLSCSSRSYTKAVRLGRNIMLAGALNGLNRALYTACPVGVTNLISCASAVQFTHSLVQGQQPISRAACMPLQYRSSCSVSCLLLLCFLRLCLCLLPILLSHLLCLYLHSRNNAVMHA